MRGAGYKAAGLAAVLVCALLRGNALEAQARTLLMEDGTLFDPAWFREQYPEAESSRRLAHKEEPAEENPDPADAASVEEKSQDPTDAVSGEEEDQDPADAVFGEEENPDPADAVSGEEGKPDPADAVSEEERNLVQTAGLSDAELYRLYQLYGQRDGLLPVNPDAEGGILLHEQQRAASRLKADKDRELGVSWETITAEIYDTDTVHVWNTEYLISAGTSRKLEEIIERFEEEGYEIGFVMVDITTGDAISYHAGAEIYSASVIKAPYIFSLLEDGVPMTRDLYLAGNQSDNDAYVRLRTAYGNRIFADWLTGTGVPAKQSETRYIMTTPLDLCRMFYKGTGLMLGDSESSEWARTIFTDSLNSAAALTIGTSENKKVYSKAGWIASTGNSVENSYTNGAIVDGEYPYVVTVMSNSLGYIGIEYAEELMPILDEIHDEMVDPQKAVSTEVTAGDISDFAQNAQGAAWH